MMRRVFVLLILSVAVFYSSAEQSIDGTVKDGQNVPVANAYVYLKNVNWPGVYTDADGKFALINGSSVISRIIKKDGMRISSVGNGAGIRLALDGTCKEAKVQMFNSKGEMVFSNNFEGKKSAEYMISFNRITQGLYLMKVAYGKNVQIFRVTPGIGSGGFFLTENEINTLKKQKSNFVDSVVVVGRSYHNALVAVESYETHGLQIQLSPSNPWKPSGALEHSRSMVKIKAKGYDFEMGQPIKTLGKGNEGPVHTVNFTYDFWMDTTEVTQGVWDSVMTAAYPNYEPQDSRPYNEGPKYPVYEVYWGAAALYCNALSKRDGYDTVYSYTSVKNNRINQRSELNGITINLAAKGYRLPSEAEWEYACKGGTSTDFFWGKNNDYYKNNAGRADVDSYAVSSTNSWLKGEGEIGYAAHEVAGLLPNGYGLYDMAGNVSEIVHDSTANYQYGTITDPIGAVNPSSYSLRGGNWANEVEYLRSANRKLNTPGYYYYWIGFRTVRVEK